MTKFKVQISNQIQNQMSNPPNPPLLKGGEGGLLIDFEIYNYIWHLSASAGRVGI
jgi:hypothetical protein